MQWAFAVGAVLSAVLGLAFLLPGRPDAPAQPLEPVTDDDEPVVEAAWSVVLPSACRPLPYGHSVGKWPGAAGTVVFGPGLLRP